MHFKGPHVHLLCSLHEFHKMYRPTSYQFFICFKMHNIIFLIGLCSAVCPYLALETCRQWRLSTKTVNLMRNGKMPTVTIEQAQKNFCKVSTIVQLYKK